MPDTAQIVEPARTALIKLPVPLPLISEFDPEEFLQRFGVPDLPLARTWISAKLRSQGFKTEITNALFDVPRHVFAGTQWNIAYADLPIKVYGAWLPEQSYVARVVEVLETRWESPRVLELGVETGYLSAVLSRMGARVTVVDSSQQQIDKARVLWSKLGFEVQSRTCSAAIAVASVESDLIVVNASLERLPAYLRTLNVVAPIVTADGSQRLMAYRSDTVLDLGPCAAPRRKA